MVYLARALAEAVHGPANHDDGIAGKRAKVKRAHAKLRVPSYELRVGPAPGAGSIKLRTPNTKLQDKAARSELRETADDDWLEHFGDTILF